MDRYRAENGLSDTGQPEGPLLSTQYVYGRSAYPQTVIDFARFFFLVISRNMHGLYEGVAPYVWLPLLILCLFGLFRSAWSQERALVELVLLSMFALACIPVLIAPYLALRFVLHVMPFFVVWSAKGVDELGDWVQQTVDHLLPIRRLGTYLRTATIMLLGAMILIIGGKNARHVAEFKEAAATSMYLKEAGLALAKRPGGKVIVDEGTVVAFYAGGTWMRMPYAPAPVILRYFEQQHPDFIVINRLIRQQDALAEALEEDPHARLLPLNLRSPLTIYEWKQQHP